MKRAIATAVLFFVFGTPYAGATEFDNCMQLFSSGDLANASARFEQLIKREPTPRNLYYCAMVHARNHNDERAVQLLQFVVQSHPASREAAMASKTLASRNAMLQELRSNKQASSDPGRGGSGQRSSGTDRTRAGTSSSGAGASSVASSNANFASRDMTGLIAIVKPLDDRPETSQSFVYEASNQLKNIPLPLVHLLREKGLKLYLTPTAVDYNPKMEQLKPRGYENGKSFRDVPAFYEPNTRHLVIAEYAFGQGSLVKTDDPMGSMWHELGHAVDHTMGDLSNDREYLRIYHNCKKNVDDAMAEKISYYLQPGETGPSETFAELFATLYGTRNTAWRQSQADRVLEVFGELGKFIRRKVAELR